MARQQRRDDLHPHIVAVMDETGEDDPVLAVRTKARAVIREYRSFFTEEPPFSMPAMASFRDLHESEDAPRFSQDSEIAPVEDGRVVLRINRDRPLTRQRFSIGHEIGHTLFPEYQLTVRCRKGTERDWADPNDLLETLCDVAASEFLFPEPWFRDRIMSMTLTADGLATLSADYQASPEATVRRLVELHSAPLAAVFFSWKLKPTEKRQLKRDLRQRSMFDDCPLPMPEPMLRVDYAITNDAFATHCGSYIPRDKSVSSKGVIYATSVSGAPQDGSEHVDLGSVRGMFDIHVLPVYTPDGTIGPSGSCSVVAVLSPAN